MLRPAKVCARWRPALLLAIARRRAAASGACRDSDAGKNLALVREDTSAAFRSHLLLLALQRDAHEGLAGAQATGRTRQRETRHSKREARDHREAAGVGHIEHIEYLEYLELNAGSI
ncbi:hypothetical protein T492DRAFT_968992 [Pavlovales sp. CCMP2436]|nr:hypothetical protein T492DRAFT_968992 [Pavlovales sp. CCMP2436]